MIARSRAIDSVRLSRGHLTEPLDHRLLIDRAESPEEAFSAKVRRLRVRSVIESLSPSQCQAIEMAFYAGMTHSEIAAKLGKPLGTVKSHIRAGMAHLRKQLEMQFTRSPRFAPSAALPNDGGNGMNLITEK